MPADILNADHLACLNKVLQACPVAREIIQKCKDSGVPVEEFEQQFAAQDQMARKLKANFFPTQP